MKVIHYRKLDNNTCTNNYGYTRKLLYEANDTFERM